jgi:hypothetical protein
MSLSSRNIRHLMSSICFAVSRRLASASRESNADEMPQFLDHLADDVLPPLLDRLSSGWRFLSPWWKENARQRQSKRSQEVNHGRVFGPSFSFWKQVTRLLQERDVNCETTINVLDARLLSDALSHHF